MEIELPGRVHVIVLEWLGGFGIDEGRSGRSSPPGPLAQAGRSDDPPPGDGLDRAGRRPLDGEMVRFLRDNPYGLNLGGLAEMTVNEIFYSGTFRHLAAGDRRSGPGRPWATDAELIRSAGAGAARAETLLPVREHGTANALALWFSAELAPGISLSAGPGDAPTHWGMTTARCAARCSSRPAWSSAPESAGPPGPACRDMDELGRRAAGAGWEEHDEQAVWHEIDD